MQVPLQGAAIDRVTQRWVIATGRRIRFARLAWLDGPVGSPDGIADEWISQHAERAGAMVSEPADGGILPDMRLLDGLDFDASTLHPDIRDFYQRTNAWTLDVWSRWSRWAEPAGRILNAVFAQRLRQLSLPLDPLDSAYGMDSRVVIFHAPNGQPLGTAWQRTLRSTGGTVFGGYYGVTVLPGAERPSIRVVFPLPNGSLTVLLRPVVTPEGNLRLISPRSGLGAHGAYLIVRPHGQEEGWARRVPLSEQFDVFADAAGQIRCDHQLRLGSAAVLRLHYRLRSEQPTTP